MDTQGWTYLSLPNYGTLCRYLVRSDVWERLGVPTCSNCGYEEDEHNCGVQDCENYVAAPFTEGFEKVITFRHGEWSWNGEVIHTATGHTVPLRAWTEEEIDDWMDNTDPFRYGPIATADNDINDAIDASGNCFQT